MTSLAGLASPRLFSSQGALDERDFDLETPRSFCFTPTETRATAEQQQKRTSERSQEHAPGRWMALSSSSRTSERDLQDGGGEPSNSISTGKASRSTGNAAFEFYDPRGLFTRRRSTLNSDGSKERAAVKAESARANAAAAGNGPSSTSSSAILSPAGSVANFSRISNGSNSPRGAGSAVSSLLVFDCPTLAHKLTIPAESIVYASAALFSYCYSTSRQQSWKRKYSGQRPHVPSTSLGSSIFGHGNSRRERKDCQSTHLAAIAITICPKTS